jgi:hypothetical protein
MARPLETAHVYSEAERIAVAQAYIDALVTHQADAVAFAPDCTRVEVGLKTGFSGDHLRRSLNRGPQYQVIKATTTPEFTVAGDEVRARFDLVTKPSLAGRRVGAHIDETFLIPASNSAPGPLIHHIRAGIRPFLTR